MSLPPEIELELSKRIVDCSPRSDQEIIRIVEDVLKDFGMDHTEWQEASEIRKDLVWVRENRQRCDNLQGRIIITIVTVVVTALLTMLVLGFKEYLEHG